MDDFMKFDCQNCNSDSPSAAVAELFSSEKMLHVFAFLTVLAFMLGGCQTDSDAQKAAALGISREQYRKMMREDPLFRHIMEQPDCKTQTRQFLDRVRAKCGAKELQDWAQQVLEKHKEDKEFSGIPHDDIPGFILSLDPPLEPSVIVFPRSHVAIDWGGGFGHWGLFVGGTSPPDNPIIYAIEWVPGVYAYHSLH
jgi:hypothetical protein